VDERIKPECIKIRRNQVVKQVDEFAYLGSTKSNDVGNMSERMKHVCQAKIIFNNITNLLVKGNISLKPRKN